MSLVTLVQTERLKLCTDRLIVSQAEFAVLLQASELLNAAQAHISEERQRLHEAFEEERTRGYEAGYQEGLKDAAVEQVRWAAMGERVQRQLETKMVRTILTVVSDILNKTDMQNFFLQTLKRVRGLLRQEKQVILKVAAQDALQVHQAVATFVREYSLSANFFDIRELPHAELGTCVIETSAGEINCNLSLQLQAIENGLKQSFAHEVKS